MNSRYFILTDENSNMYGVILMEDNMHSQLNTKVLNVITDNFGDVAKVIWESDVTLTVHVDEFEAIEFYLTETEIL